MILSTVVTLFTQVIALTEAFDSFVSHSGGAENLSFKFSAWWGLEYFMILEFQSGRQN